MTQIEIVYSNSMKINRGNYEQESPFYSAKTVVAVDDPDEIDNTYKGEYERLKGIVEPLLQADYNAKRTDLANVRIREKDDKKYPSVTSIINPDGLYKGIKNLKAYTERGNQVDKIFKHWLLTGKKVSPKPEKFEPLQWEMDLDKCIESMVDLRDSKRMSYKWTCDIEVFNENYMYSGEIDVMRDNNVIYDIKSGQWTWHQLMAYAKCLPDIEGLGIFDVKNNKCVTINVNDSIAIKAWEEFLIKRGEFKARFGI